jgi:hypothetical protein
MPPSAAYTCHCLPFPTPTTEYIPDELSTAVAIYFGNECIPVLEGIVGREIASRKGRRKCGKVNPFGSRLFCAALDESWTKAHGYVEHVIAASMGESGWHGNVKIWGLFAHELATGGDTAR